jgi:hypothetical protein
LLVIEVLTAPCHIGANGLNVAILMGAPPSRKPT